MNNDYIDESMNNLLVRLFRLPQTSELTFLLEVLSRTSEEFIRIHKDNSLSAINRIEEIIFDLEVQNFRTSNYKLYLTGRYLVKKIIPTGVEYIIAKVTLIRLSGLERVNTSSDASRVLESEEVSDPCIQNPIS